MVLFNIEFIVTITLIFIPAMNRADSTDLVKIWSSKDFLTKKTDISVCISLVI